MSTPSLGLLVCCVYCTVSFITLFLHSPLFFLFHLSFVSLSPLTALLCFLFCSHFIVFSVSFSFILFSSTFVYPFFTFVFHCLLFLLLEICCFSLSSTKFLFCVSAFSSTLLFLVFVFLWFVFRSLTLISCRI